MGLNVQIVIEQDNEKNRLNTVTKATNNMESIKTIEKVQIQSDSSTLLVHELHTSFEEVPV